VILGHFFKATANILHLALQMYIVIVLVRSVLSWMGGIPRNNTFVYILRRLTDPVFRLVHRYFPFTIVGNIDISPIIIMMGLYFIDYFLVGVLMGYANKILAGG
jgi:YggT family protein